MALRSPSTDPAPWAWVSSLRTGGTEPWNPEGHSAGARAGDDDLPAFLPGAQQLELLRRVNARARDRGVALPGGLADRVLRAGDPGRGPGDLPLIGTTDGRFGPPPVDPAALPAELLTPIAASLVAHALVERHDGAATADIESGAPAWPLIERTRAGDLVAGDPWLRGPLAPHRPLVGIRLRRRRGYLVAGDLAGLALHAWSMRCLDGEPLGLERWLHRRVTGHRLPAGVDVVAGAARLRERVGTRRTVVVTRPDALHHHLHHQLHEPPLDLGAVDVVRRVSLRLRALAPDPVRRDVVVHGLVPALARTAPAASPGSQLPQRLRSRLTETLERRAEQMAGELRRAGYPVLGSLADLSPRAEVIEAPVPSDDDTLLRLIDLLLDCPAHAEGAR